MLDQEQENARLRSEVAKAETDKLNYQRYEYLASQGAVSEMQRDQRRQAYISQGAGDCSAGHRWLQQPHLADGGTLLM